VCALGGKYFFDDDQQFPDTQTVIFEYDLDGGRRKQLIYEQRIWAPYVQGRTITRIINTLSWCNPGLQVFGARIPGRTRSA
jgi:hypothetical protein